MKEMTMLELFEARAKAAGVRVLWASVWAHLNGKYNVPLAVPHPIVYEYLRTFRSVLTIDGKAYARNEAMRLYPLATRMMLGR